MPKLKNPKHELLAKNIVKEKFNLTKAYMATYPSSSYASANTNVHQVIEKPIVYNRIQEIANAKGLTLESLIDDLNEDRQAKKPITFNGVITDEYPDYAVRLEATKTGLKIHGVLGADNLTQVDARSINVTLEPSDVAKLADTLKEIKALSGT